MAKKQRAAKQSTPAKKSAPTLKRDEVEAARRAANASPAAQAAAAKQERERRSAEAAKVRQERQAAAAKRAAARRRAHLGDWIGAARIPTLPLSVAPVILGAATVYLATLDLEGAWPHWLRFATCLAIAVCLQIGVNFANDYSDGVRGTDAGRHASAPGRLVASGKASPRAVLTVAMVWFGLAAIAGIILTVRTEHWWFLAVGAAALLAAWFYTGGKRPYGYLALGEVAVFVFFGGVAVIGTAFAIGGYVPFEAIVCAVAAGAFATATILIAHTRDIPSDRAAGKRTLSVLLGDRASRILYVVLLVVPYLAAGLLMAMFYPRAIYAMLTLLIAIPAALIALTAKSPRELVTVMRLTTLCSLAYAVLLGLAIAIW
ncbi:MAG TPA: 1,4-dihydroxy-2-naphthoate polyprenyltransferase [Microbacteriaceae bacterium]|nr:1,4-dihydroxy-2-naphthoate polyprenyltransferase [Microbacteriaceae bacterium]